jgi:hypothetical protein
MGRLPAGVEWVRATDTHPTTITARERFATWRKALEPRFVTKLTCAPLSCEITL